MVYGICVFVCLFCPLDRGLCQVFDMRVLNSLKVEKDVDFIFAYTPADTGLTFAARYLVCGVQPRVEMIADG